MKILKLPERKLPDFLHYLTSFGELHAPVKRGERDFVFNRIDDPDKIEFGCLRTILPLKKYFLKPVDTMFTFNQEHGYQSPDKEIGKTLVIFGAHACEIHGLNLLDTAMGGRYPDNYYFSRRNRALIVGLDCLPDEHCFCRSTGTDYVNDGFDLFLSDIGDGYLVWVGTSRGDDIVRAAETLLTEPSTEDRRRYKEKVKFRALQFKTEINLHDLPDIMDLEYESKAWDGLGDRCLGCGICSMVCPTCFCFAVHDELNLGGESGKRIRRWDSCLFTDYALVAGGHNFRENRSSRIKNRYFHKQRGFVSQYGRPSCVGCGRCRTACPANLDIVEVINTLKDDTYD